MEIQQTKLFKNWWLLAIKGLFILTFGLILALRDINQIEIVTYFSLIICISGLLFTHGAMYNLGRKIPWKWWLFEGLLDVVFGGLIITILSYKRLSAMANYSEIISLWALIFGIIQIITAFRFKNYSLGWFAMLISGIVALLYTTTIIVNLWVGLDQLPGLYAKRAFIGYFTILLGLIIMVNSTSLYLNKSNNHYKRTH